MDTSRGKKAQGLTEIAIIIGLVGLAFLGMEVYIRRGVNAKVKDLADNIIGSEQAAYQVDTSGLRVNTSNTTTNASSNMVLATAFGGQKTTTGTERTIISSNSQSSDTVGAVSGATAASAEPEPLTVATNIAAIPQTPDITNELLNELTVTKASIPGPIVPVQPSTTTPYTRTQVEAVAGEAEGGAQAEINRRNNASTAELNRLSGLMQAEVDRRARQRLTEANVAPDEIARRDAASAAELNRLSGLYAAEQTRRARERLTEVGPAGEQVTTAVIASRDEASRTELARISALDQAEVNRRAQERETEGDLSQEEINARDEASRTERARIAALYQAEVDRRARQRIAEEEVVPGVPNP